MRWVLGPDEFAQLWATTTGLDRGPYPVHTVAPATPPTAPATPGTRVRYTDAELPALLRLCARSDATTLTITGERGNSAAPEPILAFAAVVHSQAGILVARDDTVVVLGCHARALGEQLVQIIGSAPPGQNPQLREPHEAVLTEDGQVDAYSTGQFRAARLRHTLRAPVDGRGVVTIAVEPNNPSSPPARHRTWLDVHGDGRYLLTTAADLTLTPIDDDEFAAHLIRLARIQ